MSLLFGFLDARIMESPGNWMSQLTGCSSTGSCQYSLHMVIWLKWVFPKFSEFSDTNIFHYIKRLKHATSYVRDQDVTITPARHVRERIVKLSPFMLQWFIRFHEFSEFREFLIYLGKTPRSSICPLYWHDITHGLKIGDRAYYRSQKKFWAR